MSSIGAFYAEERAEAAKDRRKRARQVPTDLSAAPDLFGGLPSIGAKARPGEARDEPTAAQRPPLVKAHNTPRPEDQGLSGDFLLWENPHGWLGHGWVPAKLVTRILQEEGLSRDVVEGGQFEAHFWNWWEKQSPDKQDELNTQVWRYQKWRQYRKKVGVLFDRLERYRNPSRYPAEPDAPKLVYRKDAGSIQVQGTPNDPRRPKDAFKNSRGKGRGKRGKITCFSPDARRRLMRALDAVRDGVLEASLFVTRTYPGQRYERKFPDAGSDVEKRYLDIFEKAFARAYPGACLVTKKEYQERGVVHYHDVMLGDFKGHDPEQVKAELLRIWGRSIGASPDDGDFQRYGVNVVKLDSAEGVKRYLAVYAAKEDQTLPGQHVGRYWFITRSKVYRTLLGELVEVDLNYREYHGIRRWMRRYLVASCRKSKIRAAVKQLRRWGWEGMTDDEIWADAQRQLSLPQGAIYYRPDRRVAWKDLGPMDRQAIIQFGGQRCEEVVFAGGWVKADRDYVRECLRICVGVDKHGGKIRQSLIPRLGNRLSPGEAQARGWRLREGQKPFPGIVPRPRNNGSVYLSCRANDWIGALDRRGQGGSGGFSAWERSLAASESGGCVSSVTSHASL